LSVQLVSEIFNLCDHKSPTSQTDGQTDRRTTCDPKTAQMHLSALRGKNAATRCVLKALNTAKCDCGRPVGAPPCTSLGMLTASPEPMGALQGKPGGPGPGPWPTQNFGWVGHNAFGPTSNWPVYSLILFVNLLKLVPPGVRF